MTTIRNIAGHGWYGWVTLAFAAGFTLVTWFYGFWKGPTTGLILLPIGVVVFFASIGALVIPMISGVLVVVAALTMVDKGIAPVVIMAIQVFLGVGLVSFIWHFWKEKWHR